MTRTDSTSISRRHLHLFVLVCLLVTVLLYGYLISSGCSAESAAAFVQNVRAFHTSDGC